MDAEEVAEAVEDSAEDGVGLAGGRLPHGVLGGAPGGREVCVRADEQDSGRLARLAPVICKSYHYPTALAKAESQGNRMKQDAAPMDPECKINLNMTQLLSLLTQRFDGRNPAPEKGQPIVEVPELLCSAVLEAEADEVDAVHVPDEVIVEEMVIRLSGKLPHAQLPHGPQGALQRGSRTLCHNEIRLEANLLLTYSR